MKIAYDAKRFFNNSSGLGNYSRDLVRIIAEFFPENEYLLFNKNQSEKGKEILENPSVSFQTTSSGKFARQYKLGLDAQNSGAEIFHGLSGELPLKWNSKKIKKIVTIHDLIFMRFPQYYSFFDRKIHFWKFKKASENADLVIAISEQTKRDIIHFLKIPAEKIVVIYQGCHPAFKQNHSQESLDFVKNKFQLPERFVLNVGTIEERKNLLNVLKALENTDIPLVVVGKKQKNYFKKIERFLSGNSVKVQFLENVTMDELAKIYKLADIFIYPSVFEGFGIPVIEALFSKTPVITSNSSSLPEAGGKNSVYINPENVEDIRAKILHLWNSEAQRNFMAEKGLEYAQNFTDEKIAHQLENIYRKILK